MMSIPDAASDPRTLKLVIFYQMDLRLSHSFKIQNWSALAGDLKTPGDWQRWSKTPWVPQSEPPVHGEFIPKNMKRRCSRICRLALSVALEVSQDSLPDYSVFASQHGEIDRTVSLLEDIRIQQTLSPTAFSQSVHNAASGLYTIAHQARIRSTSFSAGGKTAKMAFVDAYSEILKHPQNRIQITIFDQKLPPHFQSSMVDETFDFAISLIVSKGDSEAGPIPTSRLEGALKKYPELRLLEVLCQGAPEVQLSWDQVIDLL